MVIIADLYNQTSLGIADSCIQRRIRDLVLCCVEDTMNLEWRNSVSFLRYSSYYIFSLSAFKFQMNTPNTPNTPIFVSVPVIANIAIASYWLLIV